MDDLTRKLIEDAEIKHARAVADFHAECEATIADIEARRQEHERRFVRLRQRLHTEGKDGES